MCTTERLISALELEKGEFEAGGKDEGEFEAGGKDERYESQGL